MARSDAEDVAPQVVQGMLARDAFSTWMGVELLECGVGVARLQMAVRPDMVNGFGVCHGGVTFALADSALAFACNSGEYVTVSIANSIRYPAPCRVGDRLTASARAVSTTARLGFYHVTVTTQDGTTVGLFEGTVYRTADRHPLPTPPDPSTP